jgi:glycerol-3-phosphate O-acyltransferase/dihydroxyacetone phosphate acyltransferase
LCQLVCKLQVCIERSLTSTEIGLNYFHPHRFRSRAVVSYGAPISIEPEMVENYIKGGQAKREAISTLLNSGYEALKSVTVNAPNYDTLMVSHLLSSDSCY